MIKWLNDLSICPICKFCSKKSFPVASLNAYLSSRHNLMEVLNIVWPSQVQLVCNFLQFSVYLLCNILIFSHEIWYFYFNSLVTTKTNIAITEKTIITMEIISKVITVTTITTITTNIITINMDCIINKVSTT